MMPFVPRSLGSACFACLTLLGSPLAAHAQIAAHHASEARAILRAAAAAHTALTSLTATLAVHSTGADPPRSQTLALLYRKPHSARLSLADNSGPLVQFISDGKTLITYDVRNKLYQQDRLRPGVPVIAAVFSQTDALLPGLIADPSGIIRLLSHPGVAVRLGAPALVNGVQADTVLVTLPENGGPTTFLNFAIGRRDHLMRRLTESESGFAGGQLQATSLTETCTRLMTQPALTAAAFVFRPPPGVRKYTLYDPRLVPGARPIPFTAKDLAGRPLSLSQYRGKVVLLDFWATWCPPCVGEMPDVLRTYKKYHTRGFDIVGLSLDTDRSALAAFIRQNHMPWRQVFGGNKFDSPVPHQYGVMAIPFSLLIGRDGKIRAAAVHGPELAAAVAKAVVK